MSNPIERRHGEARPDEVASVENPLEDAERATALQESAAPAVSEPGGFANDPDDPTNPNEAIERHRRSLRPRTSG